NFLKRRLRPSGMNNNSAEGPGLLPGAIPRTGYRRNAPHPLPDRIVFGRLSGSGQAAGTSAGGSPGGRPTPSHRRAETPRTRSPAAAGAVDDHRSAGLLRLPGSIRPLGRPSPLSPLPRGERGKG